MNPDDPSPDDPRAMAADVRAELLATGLPVLAPIDERTELASGADVIAGGDAVYVSWCVNSPLSTASVRATYLGAYRTLDNGVTERHPAMRHSSVVAEAMTEAIRTILRSVGYGVQSAPGEQELGKLRVTQRASGPNWTDPPVPPLAGSAGYGPGVRVRILAGEFAGSTTTIVTSTRRLTGQRPLRYQVRHPHGHGELELDPEHVTLADDRSLNEILDDADSYDPS